MQVLGIAMSVCGGPPSAPAQVTTLVLEACFKDSFGDETVSLILKNTQHWPGSQTPSEVGVFPDSPLPLPAPAEQTSSWGCPVLHTEALWSISVVGFLLGHLLAVHAQKSCLTSLSLLQLPSQMRQALPGRATMGSNQTLT